MNEKKCARCSLVKTADRFATYSGKLYVWCRACQCESSKSYYKANREKRLAAASVYRSENKEKLAASIKAWRESNPDKVVAQNKRTYAKLKSPLYHHKRNLARYGLTVEQYEAMYRAQNGGCAICTGFNVAGRRLAVDHNHKTSKVRGLLCTGCNAAIGHAKESIDILKGIIAYLEKHETLASIGVL